MRVVGLRKSTAGTGWGCSDCQIGLILKAPSAWAFSLVLLIESVPLRFLARPGAQGWSLYTLVLLIALIVYWQPRRSVAAGRCLHWSAMLHRC